jgi:putative flippase GtrA
VGAIGSAVQIGAVTALTAVAHWPAVPATAAAVEAAVLHNFVWHERWTWRDRAQTRGGLGGRLLRFHVANGVTSIAGNVIISAALTRAGLGAIPANVIAVGVMSAMNYALADQWVFGRHPENAPLSDGCSSR